ncbi:hypothetical protein CAEBREN_02222 [Caenorhabditis brenneri]|uniref:Uncharacterized protein n=1 Tax=Caenorhabditis brenneri TaxID=135651 RepID=G0NDH4_CAEBE|nr:hypothetical protein CAEBREN_02222 [Caenorhabditis brenneri]
MSVDKHSWDFEARKPVPGLVEIQKKSPGRHKGRSQMLQKNYIALGLLEEIDGRRQLEKKPDEKEEIFGAVTVHQ